MPELNSVLGDATFSRTPGGVAAAIKNRFHKWSPREFNANAKPYGAQPSDSVMTQTTEAINDMWAEDIPCEFEAGTYYCNGTIATASFQTAVRNTRTFVFNNTEFKAVGSASDFVKHKDQSGTADIGPSTGTGSAGTNLPEPVAVPVFFDITNTKYHEFRGMLTINGTNAIACLACANSQGCNGGTGGAVGSVWDSIILKNGKWGLFGQPRYGQSRQKYTGTFVGNIVKRMRIDNCYYPILAGGNTIDDSFIGELNIIMADNANNADLASRCYIYTCNFTIGNIYANHSVSANYVFDIENTNFKFGNFYAEDHMAAPLIVRNGSFVEGVCKMGGGADTVFGKKAFIYCPDATGGGCITINERSKANDVVGKGMVLLKAVANANRNWWVKSPWVESDIPPFIAESGASMSNNRDRLACFSRDGLTKWTMSGTAGSPTVARSATII